MRVLMITQDFPPHVGGIQTFALEMARGLAKRCHDFAVVAPRLPGSAEVDAGLPFEVQRVWTHRHGLLPVLGFPAAVRAVRRMKPEVVFHANWQGLPIGLTARRLGWTQRVVVSTYGRELRLQPAWPFNHLVNGVCGRTLRASDGVAVISRYTGQLVASHGVAPARTHLVPCGTDPAQFYPTDPAVFRARLQLPRTPIILTVARLQPHKGIDTVIRAMPEVRKAIPEAVYVVGGRGPDEARLRALAAELGVADHVRFIGRVEDEDLRDCYSACDVFVTASREVPPSVEGFGIVFLEAGACGRPVIGTTTGGIPDAVADGDTGFLVPPEDPPALAARIIQLLRDPELSRRMGERGRQRVIETLNWDGAAQRMFETLQRVRG